MTESSVTYNIEDNSECTALDSSESSVTHNIEDNSECTALDSSESSVTHNIEDSSECTALYSSVTSLQMRKKQVDSMFVTLKSSNRMTTEKTTEPEQHSNRKGIELIRQV